MWKHKNFINLQLCAGDIIETTINWDSHVTKVVLGEDIDIWTQSSSVVAITAYPANDFNVTLNEGYILDTVTATNGITIRDITENTFHMDSPGEISATTITITSKSTSTNYLITDTELTAIADATRAKADITTKLTPAQIAEKINNLTIVADIDTSDKMATLLVAENEGNVYKYVGTTTSDYINGDLYAVEAAPSSGETWVLNETLNISGTVYYNNIEMSYSGMTRTYPIKSLKMYEYSDGPETACSIYGEEESEYKEGNSKYQLYGTGGGHSGWDHSQDGTAFNVWTFTTPPTGDLLTWLQANGTKQ